MRNQFDNKKIAASVFLFVLVGTLILSNSDSIGNFITSSNGYSLSVIMGPNTGYTSSGDGYHILSWQSSGNNSTAYNSYYILMSYPDGTSQRLSTTSNSLKLNNKEDLDNSCDIKNGAYRCLLPNIKTTYTLSNSNGANLGSGTIWTPVNVVRSVMQAPVTVKTIVTSPTTVTNNVHWVANFNPDSTKYVVCRAKRTLATQPSSSSFKCVQKNPTNGVITLLDKQCDLLQSSDLDTTNIGVGCYLNTGRDYTDKNLPSGVYDYKIVSVNNGCLDGSNSDNCFIAKPSVAGTGTP